MQFKINVFKGEALEAQMKQIIIFKYQLRISPLAFNLWERKFGYIANNLLVSAMPLDKHIYKSRSDSELSTYAPLSQTVKSKFGFENVFIFFGLIVYIINHMLIMYLILTNVK